MIIGLLAAALTLPQALDNMRELETLMGDCGAGMRYSCKEMMKDEYEEKLNEITIFVPRFEPASDAERDELNEAIRNLHNASEDADRFLQPEKYREGRKFR